MYGHLNQLYQGEKNPQPPGKVGNLGAGDSWDKFGPMEEYTMGPNSQSKTITPFTIPDD
jgi:hypothetical protein